MTYSRYGSYSKYSYDKSGWDKPDYKTYEFTAFTKDDLFGGGNGKCGSTFEMPTSASVCLTVSDDDCKLSGDGSGWCGNDRATDYRGQTAAIQDADGNEAGNGGQIYAESYHWVCDQDGYWYLMIEIEQEGSCDSYFTFHSAYGIPPAGSELTVKQTCNVSGDWLKYDDLGAGDSCVPTGSITGTAWCDDCDGIQEFETTITKGDPIFTHSVTYESVTCTKYNVDCYGDWRSTGCDTIDLVVGSDQGHYGNACDNTIVELDKGGVWSRDFKVDMAGTYCLSFDTYYNSCAGQYGNSFDVVINGQVVDTVTVTEDGQIELSVELQHGANEIEFVSKSCVSGYGAGIDDVNFQQLIETTTRSEPVKEGIQVKLLYVDGSPVLDENGQEIVTYTDADGNYRFDDIPVGDYKIMGVAPDGTKFTIQDVGSDDSVDSDVDANGMSGVISVTADGEADVDLGLCEDDNEEPTATDDMGMGCADELIYVDLSDNYADADSSSVDITMIDGVAIADGETKLISGIEVTRDGDTFSFDGEAAFAYLDIGEKATQTLTYTVEDSDGAMATANIDLTFCGDANSYASLAATFPTDGEYQVLDALFTDPAGSEAYTVLMNGTGDARFDGVYFDNAYCLDIYAGLAASGDWTTAPVNTGKIVSADVFQLADDLSDARHVSFFNGLTAADNMDLVKYIVAQDYEGQGLYDGWDVQFAIWELVNNYDSDQSLQYFEGLDAASIDAILADAAANGEGFSFGPDTGTAGAIIDPTESGTGNVQPMIIGFNYEAYDCLC